MFDDALRLSNSIDYGNSMQFGNSYQSGNSQQCGYSRQYGDSQQSGNSIQSGSSSQCENSIQSGNSIQRRNSIQCKKSVQSDGIESDKPILRLFESPTSKRIITLNTQTGTISVGCFTGSSLWLISPDREQLPECHWAFTFAKEVAEGMIAKDLDSRNFKLEEL